MARIAFVLVDPYADWELGHLAPGAKSDFGDEVRFLTPGGRPVTSMGGLRVAADGAVEDFDPAGADALVAIGSPVWDTPETPDIGDALRKAESAGCVVGGICGAVFALARAGLLDDRAHTGNSLSSLKQFGGAYRGEARYRDQARAVSDRRVVTASGLAPVSFAAEVLQLLHPERAGELVEFQGYFAREHQPVR